MALRQNARVRIGSLALRAEQVGSRVPFHEPDWKAAGTKLCRSLAQLPAGTLAHRGVQPTAISAQPAIDAVLRDDSISDLGRAAGELGQRGPISEPGFSTSSSGDHLRPGETWPPLRPDAPYPGQKRSTTITCLPLSARCSAVDNPVKPAPTTQTSLRKSPASC